MEYGRSNPTSSGPVPAEYIGFKGMWESRSRVFVFESCEERDRWQIHRYGHVRNGFREPDEIEDDRPAIARDRCRCKGCRDRAGFWNDESERMNYEDAVESFPRGEDEGPMAYSKRIAESVNERYQRALKPMPHTRMSNRARDLKLQLLRGQVQEVGE